MHAFLRPPTADESGAQVDRARHSSGLQRRGVDAAADPANTVHEYAVVRTQQSAILRACGQASTIGGRHSTPTNGAAKPDSLAPSPAGSARLAVLSQRRMEAARKLAVPRHTCP